MNGPRPIQKRMTKSKVNKQGARFDPKQAAAQLRSAIVNEAPHLYARVRELEAELAEVKQWRHDDNEIAVEMVTELRMRAERAEAERDAISLAHAAIVGENMKLRALLTDISNTVLLTCENVHHAKSERNHAMSTCPVVDRLTKAIDAALKETP